MSFLVFSLPRSRSTWMSVFLSYGGRTIGHDIGLECSTPREFLTRIGDGTCETGAGFAYPAIRKARPDLKFAVVMRDPGEVHVSLLRYGVNVLTELQERDNDLWDISRLKGTLTLDYENLDTEAGCRRLFEFCLEQPFDRAWWQRWRHINVQVDVMRELQRAVENRDGIARLKAEARAMAVL